MEADPKQREIADKILKAIENKYGFVPVVNQVMSERPDIMIPAADFSKSVLDRDDGAIDRKNRFLCAVSAAAALGGEYCLRVNIQNAKGAGASRDEILECIMIGSYMSMTRSQSYALRAFAEAYDIELDDVAKRK